MVFIAGELGGRQVGLGESGSDLENAAICLCQVIVARTCLSAVCLGCTRCLRESARAASDGPMVRAFCKTLRKPHSEMADIVQW